MAEEQQRESRVGDQEAEVQVKDRGLLDFARKNKGEEEEKKNKAEEEARKKAEEAKTKLRRSGSSSSSSSSEEEYEGEGDDKEKTTTTTTKTKKKKQGLVEKIKDKICGEEGETKKTGEDTIVTVEKVDCTIAEAAVEGVKLTEESLSVAPQDEKKGFLEKIKEKIPGGHHKKPADREEGAESEAAKEKKGFLGKFMEKIPGYNKSSGPPPDAGGAASAP